MDDPMAIRHFWIEKKFILSAGSGILLALAFPPSRLGFMAYWGLIPFFFAMKDANYRQAMKWGYIAGLFLNIGTLYWISWVTIPGTIAAILYLPIYFVLYAILHVFIRDRLGEKYLFWCIPFIWTGIEYIKSLGVMGFPWTSLAYTQTYYLTLIQYVSYTSLFGVSFWVVIINVIIMLILRNYDQYKKLIGYFLILLTLFILPWIYGKIVIPKNDDVREKIRVALVQGNIDPYLKSDESFWEENFEIYSALSREVAEERPQLIVWPETAMPCYLRFTSKYLNRVRGLTDDLQIPLLTGAHDFDFKVDGDYLTYNAVFLILPNDNSLQNYSKLHLVPFGERVPFTETFPLLKNFLESLEMGEGNFSPGNRIVTFEIPLHDSEKGQLTRILKVPVIICFESLFPDLVRKFIMDKEAQILIIITNDGWFKRTSAPFHHAQAAVFRAIENRIAIARSANTGVSMFIDPYGRTLEASPIFEKCALINDLPLRTETTFFSEHGNIFSATVTMLNLFPLLIALFVKNQREVHV